jgi:hypothetical protein
MIWFFELDEAIIVDFCRECAVIASLPPHPNVVPTQGLCIFPPVLCLVTDLCQSTLFELLHGDSVPGAAATTVSPAQARRVEFAEHEHTRAISVPAGGIASPTLPGVISSLNMWIQQIRGATTFVNDEDADVERSERDTAFLSAASKNTWIANHIPGGTETTAPANSKIEIAPDKRALSDVGPSLELLSHLPPPAPPAPLETRRRGLSFARGADRFRARSSAQHMRAINLTVVDRLQLATDACG